MRNALAAAFWFNLVMMLMGLSILAVPAMAPAIAEDLGLSTTLVGTYTALLWAGSITTSMAVGHLVGRFGSLRVSQLSLALCAAGLLAAGLGPAPCLAIAAVMIGMGQGAETPASSSLLARITPANSRPLVFSLKQTGGQIGGVLAGAVFPALLPWTGWRGALLATTLAILAAALLLEFPRRRFEPRIERQSAAQRVSFSQALRLIASDGRMLRLTIVIITYVAVHVCQQAFLVSYLVAERQLSLVLAGSLLAIAQAGGLIGRVFWGILSGRVFSAVAVLALIGVGMLACAGLLGGFGAAMPVAWLAVLCFFFGMTAGGWAGVHIAEMARLVPSEAVSQITGALLVVGTIGLILGPIAFAALAAATSFGTSYVMSAAWALLGTFALVFPGRKQPARSGPP